MQSSPWGSIQHIEAVAPGIVWVSTPGHGGIGINKAAAARQLTPEAICRGISWGEHLFFEEDCAWAIVAYELPAVRAQVFGHAEISEAEQEAYLLGILSQWNRTYLLGRGIEPTTREYFCEECRSTVNCIHQA